MRWASRASIQTFNFYFKLFDYLTESFHKWKTKGWKTRFINPC